MGVSDASLEEIGRILQVIASDVRLRILRELREPKRVSAIRVEAGLTRKGERPERPLSRQAVTSHLEQLRGVGLVREVPGSGDGRGASYVVDHGRMFALLDELRALNRLRAYGSTPLDVDTTLSDEAGLREGQKPRPRLVEAYGAEDGRAFQLTRQDPVELGRGETCDIQVDHDPYVSARHCRIERRDGEWLVEDLGSSNGTWVNWDPLPPGELASLDAGDLLRVGRTVLVLQP